MGSFKVFIGISVSAVALTVGMVLILGKTENPTVSEPVRPLSYVDIGNNIKRTDDLEKGISCYKSPGGAMSCVLTKRN